MQSRIRKQCTYFALGVCSCPVQEEENTVASMPPVPTEACKNMYLHVHVSDHFLYAVSAIESIRQQGD